MRRAIVIVLDGCGAGAAPDSREFGDDAPSTIEHVWNHVGGFDAPILGSIGFLRAGGVPSGSADSAAYGRLQPLSKGGKDSVTGHWEMMGVVIDQRFPTYPDGTKSAGSGASCAKGPTRCSASSPGPSSGTP